MSVEVLRAGYVSACCSREDLMGKGKAADSLTLWTRLSRHMLFAEQVHYSSAGTEISF